MLKAKEIETPRLLMCIFRETWESEMIPEAWKTGLIVKLPEKGDLGECNNWRGVTLLPITGKFFSKIIHTRLAETLEASTSGRNRQVSALVTRAPTTFLP